MFTTEDKFGLSEKHADQTNLPKLVVPAILDGVITNVGQFRNKYGAIIRTWDDVIKPEEASDEQSFAVIGLMFG